MSERIVEEESSWWIVLNGTNEISDNLLDELKEKHNNYYDIKIVQDGDIHNCPSFYDYMVDHVRLEEFLESDIHNIFSRFKDGNKVTKKFIDIVEKMLAKKIKANDEPKLLCSWSDTNSTIGEYFG